MFSGAVFFFFFFWISLNFSNRLLRSKFRENQSFNRFFFLDYRSLCVGNKKAGLLGTAFIYASWKVPYRQFIFFSSNLPHCFTYFLFPSFCLFEYPAINSLSLMRFRSVVILSLLTGWSVKLANSSYDHYDYIFSVMWIIPEYYLHCAKLSLSCSLW